MAGCYKWGFEPKTVEDCPLIGGGDCPALCRLYSTEWCINSDDNCEPGNCGKCARNPEKGDK
jgi:hypothetical protein